MVCMREDATAQAIDESVAKFVRLKCAAYDDPFFYLKFNQYHHENHFHVETFLINIRKSGNTPCISSSAHQPTDQHTGSGAISNEKNR